ncbi:MAG: DNA-3-methyladenine glycosylase [Acidobacteriota bacterium]|nr:DNA-3-methyladenine glycosylase [Acidobacteriota bacterium]
MRKAINHLKKADPVMAAIIAQAGPYRVEYRDPAFQTLVRSIVYQQLNGKAALTIFNRLAEAAKVNPMTPQSILNLRPQKMRAVGLSKQKTLYIRELARLTRDGEIQFERLAEMEDAAIIETLTRVKGVGVWTVQMFLMFALRRPNVLPVGDLGVRAAMQKAYGLAELPKPGEMERIAAAWHPYRSVASWYLWRSLENTGAM